VGKHHGRPDHNEEEPFIMATDKLTTITVKETKCLADRLACRGLSMFSADSPEQKRDLLLAARTIRAMARHVNDADVLYLDRNLYTDGDRRRGPRPGGAR
jgi:hypothetical protein